MLKEGHHGEPIFALPNFAKTLEVHIDASDYAIEGLFTQEGHPIAFESQKLNDMERRYTTQEMEMTIVFHCLQSLATSLAFVQILSEAEIMSLQVTSNVERSSIPRKPDGEIS